MFYQLLNENIFAEKSNFKNLSPSIINKNNYD